jgi:hypothetical protein
MECQSLEEAGWSKWDARRAHGGKLILAEMHFMRHASSGFSFAM